MLTAMSRAALCALLAVPFALPAARGAEGTEKTSKAQGGARQALDQAQKLRRAASKKVGEERRAQLESAIAAYRKVVDECKDEPREAAEAAFRAGEIERSLGDAAGAREAFEKSVALGKSAPQFGARALNELAHLARREKKLDAAMALYKRVPAEYPQQEAEGARAMTWVGKLLVEQGKAAEARASWLAIGDQFKSQPVLAIRAADLAAMSLVQANDEAGASAIVEQVEKRFGPGNPDLEFWTPDVDAALAKMKVRKALGEDSGDDGGDSDN